MPTYLIEREFREDDRLTGLRPAHRSYWLRQANAGMLLVGGSWSEGGGEMLVLRAVGLSAVHAALGDDPLTRERLVRETGIRVLEDLLQDGTGLPDELHEAGKAPTSPELPVAGRAVTAGATGTTARGGPGGPPALADLLNAHELRVAQLILSGMTNREIADAFRVTSRAVEQHITRIYRTLRISRRAQLANALRGLDPGHLPPLVEAAS